MQALPRGAGQRVLFVDDEVALARVVGSLLERIGYRPLVLSDARAARSAFEASPHEFSIVVTDHAMPELTGVQLARCVSALRPGIPIVLTSGKLEPAELEQARAAGIHTILSKPFDVRAFAQVLAACLA